MLVKVGLLSKSQVAFELILEWTGKWSLFRVDSEMVVEVVPFPEVHRASWIVALKYFQESFSLWIFEFENSERPRGRYMVIRLLLVDFDPNHLVIWNMVRFYYLHELTVDWNLLLDTIVLDFRAPNLLRCLWIAFNMIVN